MSRSDVHGVANLRQATMDDLWGIGSEEFNQPAVQSEAPEAPAKEAVAQIEEEAEKEWDGIIKMELGEFSDGMDAKQVRQALGLTASPMGPMADLKCRIPVGRVRVSEGRNDYADWFETAHVSVPLANLCLGSEDTLKDLCGKAGVDAGGVGSRSSDHRCADGNGPVRIRMDRDEATGVTKVSADVNVRDLGMHMAVDRHVFETGAAAHEVPDGLDDSLNIRFDPLRFGRSADGIVGLGCFSAHAISKLSAVDVLNRYDGVSPLIDKLGIADTCAQAKNVRDACDALQHLGAHAMTLRPEVFGRFGINTNANTHDYVGLRDMVIDGSAFRALDPSDRRQCMADMNDALKYGERFNRKRGPEYDALNGCFEFVVNGSQDMRIELAAHPSAQVSGEALGQAVRSADAGVVQCNYAINEYSKYFRVSDILEHAAGNGDAIEAGIEERRKAEADRAAKSATPKLDALRAMSARSGGDGPERTMEVPGE